MKKSLALAVSLATLGMAANAATVYDKDGTTLAIGGRVQAVAFNGHYNYAGEHDDSLVNSARLSMSGKTKVLDYLSAIAFTEWDMADGHSAKTGDKIASREQYVGADFGKFGKVIGGKTFDVNRAVHTATDIYEDIDIQNDFGLNGDRRNGIIRYDINNSGFFGSVHAQIASDDIKVFGKKLDVESGYGAAVGYTFDNVCFGPLSVKAGYSYLKGQDDDVKGRDEFDFADAKHTVASVAWGLPTTGLYLAGSAYRYDSEFNKLSATALKEQVLKGYELVVGYSFDSGVALIAGYNHMQATINKYNGKEEDYTFKRVPLQVRYAFNSNFKVWTEGEFDAGSDDKRTSINPINGKDKLNRGTQLSAGARYTF